MRRENFIRLFKIKLLGGIDDGDCIILGDKVYKKISNTLCVLIEDRECIYNIHVFSQQNLPYNLLKEILIEEIITSGYIDDSHLPNNRGRKCIKKESRSYPKKRYTKKSKI